MTDDLNRSGSQKSVDELSRAWTLTWVLARREITAEFKGVVIGRLWSLINPLATIAVFAVIFGLIFRGYVEDGINSGINSFALYIGIGVLYWGYFSRIISNGMKALMGNADLLKKVYFPRYVLVLASTLAQTSNFLFELLALTIVCILIGGFGVLPYLLLLIPALILTAAFGTGLALVMSIGVVYFRDIQHFWLIFNQIWMYASGVVFPLKMLLDAQDSLTRKGLTWNGQPLPLELIFRSNPAELFLELFRAVFYDFAVPSYQVWLASLAWTVFMLGLGILVFHRHSGRIVEEL